MELGGTLTKITDINQDNNQLSFSGQGNIGIGTSLPESTARLDVSSTTQGFLPPRMTSAQRNGIISPAEGLIIYNTTEKCINYHNNSTWMSMCGASRGMIAALNCGSAANTGLLISGTPASGVSASVPYTGSNGGAYFSEDVASTGVTGLTASHSGGTLNIGNGSINYVISGTPSSTGTADFAVAVGGQSCMLSIPVVTGGTIASFDCSSSSTTGTLISGSPASGVSSSIPYTGGNGGAYSGGTVPSTGVTGLTASISSGNFSNGAGHVIYTISGTPSSSGNAVFVLNTGGQSCTLTLPVSAAASITALNCGSATTTGNLTPGNAASGVSSSIPYTNGNGGFYTGQSIISTGVTGLTATIASGNLATGNGNLIYTISGTPAAAGTAVFAVNIAGQSCSLSINIATAGSVGSITALNCNSSATSGTIAANTAVSGVTSTVPYTGGNGGSYTGAICEFHRSYRFNGHIISRQFCQW